MQFKQWPHHMSCSGKSYPCLQFCKRSVCREDDRSNFPRNYGISNVIIGKTDRTLPADATFITMELVLGNLNHWIQFNTAWLTMTTLK